MSSWQIVFDYTRRIGFPLGPKERLHGAGSVPAERLRSMGIARGLGFLDQIEALAMIENDRGSGPMFAGGGWAFAVSPTGQLMATGDPRGGGAGRWVLETVRTAFPGALPGSSDRQPFLRCPILRAAFMLVPDRDRHEMSMDLRRQVLEHHGIPGFDDIASRLSEEITARIAAGADVLHRVINVGSIEAFSGDLEAYLSCAIIPQNPTTDLERPFPLAPHHVGTLAVQMRDRDLANPAPYLAREIDDVRWIVISALLSSLGSDREMTLANLADMLLLEGAEREDLMERGSHAVARWVDALRSLDGWYDLVDFVHRVTRSFRFLRENVEHFQKRLHSVSSDENRACDKHIVAEYVLASGRVPDLDEPDRDFCFARCKVDKGYYMLRADGCLEETENGARLTRDGLRYLSKARADFIGCDPHRSLQPSGDTSPMDSAVWRARLAGFDFHTGNSRSGSGSGEGEDGDTPVTSAGTTDWYAFYTPLARNKPVPWPPRRARKTGRKL